MLHRVGLRLRTKMLLIAAVTGVYLVIVQLPILPRIY